jgi:hypothetical protein
VPEFKLPRVRAIAPLTVLGSLLAGCSSLPSMPSMSLPSWFTSSGSNANASATSMASLPADFECPQVQVRSGASTLSAPLDATPTNLRFQVNIGTTARECRVGAAPNTISLKVGMQGRVILGPEGGGVTNIMVPVRFAVVQEAGVDTKVIATKLDRVPVAIPSNDTSFLFSHVTEGLDFAMPRGNAIDYYIIYVGFDPASIEPEKPKRPPPRRPAKPPRQTG